MLTSIERRLPPGLLNVPRFSSAVMMSGGKMSVGLCGDRGLSSQLSECGEVRGCTGTCW